MKVNILGREFLFERKKRKKIMNPNPILKIDLYLDLLFWR